MLSKAEWTTVLGGLLLHIRSSPEDFLDGERVNSQKVLMA